MNRAWPENLGELRHIHRLSEMTFCLSALFSVPLFLYWRAVRCLSSLLLWSWLKTPGSSVRELITEEQQKKRAKRSSGKVGWNQKLILYCSKWPGFKVQVKRGEKGKNDKKMQHKCYLEGNRIILFNPESLLQSIQFCR